jgi:hypothetical protein
LNAAGLAQLLGGEAPPPVEPRGEGQSEPLIQGAAVAPVDPQALPADGAVKAPTDSPAATQGGQLPVEPASEFWRARAQLLEAELRAVRAREARLEVELARLGDQIVERELAALRVTRQLAERQTPGAPRVGDLGSALESYLGLPAGSLTNGAGGSAAGAGSAVLGVPAGAATEQGQSTGTESARTSDTPPVSGPQPMLAADSPAIRRGRELPGPLTALLRLEGVRSFDLFDAGAVLRAADATAPAGAGPVILRRFDPEGYLAGHLYARRLTLSGSRSGHTLTLHLEDGHSSAGGLRQPFAQGRLNLPLRNVNPAPFLQAFPELFVDPPVAVPDDGRYPKAWLQYTLNRLLAEDAGGSHYQLAWYEGVAEECLRTVELIETDLQGRELRRLFADRLWIELTGERLALVLEQGVSQRAGESMPFLDGRLKLYFPRANLDRWRSSGLPGCRAVPPGADSPAGNPPGETPSAAPGPAPAEQPALDPAGGAKR